MVCSHLKTVESHPECETVCIDCGQVLEQGSIMTEPIIDELHYGEMQAYLEDLVHNAYIYEGAVKPALFMYNILRADSALRNFSKKEIVCYCLFLELIKSDVGRSMTEIAYFGGVCKTRMYKIQSALCNGEELEPRHLLPRIMDELLIPFSFQSPIMNIIDELNHLCSAKPETKVACAIYVYCERKNYEIDKKKICKQCCVQWPSVKSLISKYVRK